MLAQRWAAIHDTVQQQMKDTNDTNVDDENACVNASVVVAAAVPDDDGDDVNVDGGLGDELVYNPDGNRCGYVCDAPIVVPCTRYHA